MRLYLSRRPNGTYMLSRLKPVVARIRGTRERDVYAPIGEPVAVMHLCAPGIKALLGRELQLLETIPVELTMKEPA